VTKPGKYCAALRERPRLLAALAAALVVLLAAACYRHYSPFLSIDDNWFLSEAEAFYHGLGTGAELDSMPLTGFYYSLLAHHFSPLWLKFFLGFSVVSFTLVTFALGSALCSPACGALGSAIMLAVFLSFRTLVNWGRYFETSVFTLLTGLIAVFLLYYRASGKKRDAAALGILIGCSLLCRSTFFLFPFFLFAYFLFQREQLKLDWRTSLLIVALPCLMLAPWWLMKWELFHKFTLFEAFRAKANIITGLLGFVNTINGGYQEALSIAHLDASADLWAWGLGQLRHNFTGIAGAVILRLWKTLAFAPLLSILALGSLFAARLDGKLRALLALLLYFIGIHALMPVEDRYFIPLIPILALLIARGAVLRCGFAGPEPGNAGGGYSRLSNYLLAGLLACGPLLLYAHLRSYSANLRSPDRDAVLRLETAAYPDDTWLLEQTNERNLRRRLPIDAAATAGHLEERGAGTLRFQYLLDEAVNGRQAPRAELRDKTGPEHAAGLNALLVLQALEKAGRAAALKEFAEDESSCKARQLLRFRYRDSKSEKASFNDYSARTGDLCPGEFAAEAESLLEYYPPARALTLAGALCAEKVLDPLQLRPLAVYWQNEKDFRNSLALLDLLLRYRPDSPELWSDKGMQEFSLGRPQQAITAFRRAIKLSPGFIPAYVNLGVVLEMTPGGGPGAEEVYGKALAALTPEYASFRPLLTKKAGTGGGN